MYRVKKLLVERLSLRNYNVQVDETYAMIKELNKLTGFGMSETQCAVWELLNFRLFGALTELRNKDPFGSKSTRLDYRCEEYEELAKTESNKFGRGEKMNRDIGL